MEWVLSTRKEVQTKFEELRMKSRAQLIKQIYKKAPHKAPSESVESQLTSVFCVLLQSFDKENSVIKQIASMFNIDLGSLKNLSLQDKSRLVQQKIFFQVQQKLKINKQQELNFQEKQINNPQRHFQWIGVKSDYTSLRALFEEILLQKVKLFDKELTQITNCTQLKPNQTEQLLKSSGLLQQASIFCLKSNIQKNNVNSTFYKSIQDNKIRSLSKNLQNNFSTLKSQNLPPAQKQTTKNMFTNLSQFQKQKKLKGRPSSCVSLYKQQIRQKIKKEFTNIQIRDKSQFQLKKWTQTEQLEFRAKKKHTLKIHNVPVLFQFVKKYTTTLKARDNIFKKWQERQKTGITPEQLRYLCATSVFLNNSLNNSQKVRIKKNVLSAGKSLLSKLEFNIAQKIIQTYKVLTKKVSDLRAKFYQKQTQKRKLIFSKQKQTSKKIKERNQMKKQINRGVQMYKRIVQGERMQLRLNNKILKWVVYFIKKLKKKRNVRFEQRQKQKRCRSEAIIKRLKSGHLSSRVIKREQGQSVKAKKYMNEKKFYYQNSFEQSINQFNNKKIPYNQAYKLKMQLSGGPLLSTEHIYINLARGKVQLTSTRCLKNIIRIQARWKAYFYHKKYIVIRDKNRAKEQKQFQQKLHSLHLIYPLNRRINLNAVKGRIKNISIDNLIKPYRRKLLQPLRFYTSFCKDTLSQQHLRGKHLKNGKVRMRQLTAFMIKNEYALLKRSGIVLTNQQINSQLGRFPSPMWWAVHHGNLELARIFLQGGGNPNSINNEKSTCLHEAFKRGQSQMIFTLLDYGGNLNLRDNKQATPLFYASGRLLTELGLDKGSVLHQGQAKDNNYLYFKGIQPEDVYQEHRY